MLRINAKPVGGGNAGFINIPGMCFCINPAAFLPDGKA
jgi:hypothetical protein